METQDRSSFLLLPGGLRTGSRFLLLVDRDFTQWYHDAQENKVFTDTLMT